MVTDYRGLFYDDAGPFPSTAGHGEMSISLPFIIVTRRSHGTLEMHLIFNFFLSTKDDAGIFSIRKFTQRRWSSCPPRHLRECLPYMLSISYFSSFNAMAFMYFISRLLKRLLYILTNISPRSVPRHAYRPAFPKMRMRDDDKVPLD